MQIILLPFYPLHILHTHTHTFDINTCTTPPTGIINQRHAVLNDDTLITDEHVSLRGNVQIKQL